MVCLDISRGEPLRDAAIQFVDPDLRASPFAGNLEGNAIAIGRGRVIVDVGSTSRLPSESYQASRTSLPPPPGPLPARACRTRSTRLLNRGVRGHQGEQAKIGMLPWIRVEYVFKNHA